MKKRDDVLFGRYVRGCSTRITRHLSNIQYLLSNLQFQDRPTNFTYTYEKNLNVGTYLEAIIKESTLHLSRLR